MEKPFYIVALGASAGGQNALIEFVKNIPRNLRAAFVVVTHLWRHHHTNLHIILGKACALPVSIIHQGERIEPAHIYVMPEDVELTIQDGLAHLDTRAPHNRINHCIDIFFKSLAEDQGEHAIGVIFSGAGTDGTKGVQHIHRLSGKVFIQQPQSAAFMSMPQSAINSDHPQYVGLPADLAKLVTDIVLKKTKISSYNPNPEDYPN